MSAEMIVIVDTSGSMSARDVDGSDQSRYERACEELKLLQVRNSGKVAVIGFSNNVQFFPGGIPTFEMGGTQMAKALEFTKVADVEGMTFFLISDGQPTDGSDAVLQVARGYKNKINTIYCGPEGGQGQYFLSQLAKASGGVFATAEKARELASTVETMLLEG
jgi:Mg-chelatase subunit ChlD